jgi:flagellar hook-associated protein 2
LAIGIVIAITLSTGVFTMAIDTNYAQTMATQLAQFDVQAATTKSNRNEKSYKSKLSAVTSLESALKTFASSVKSLKGVGSNSAVLVNTATFSSADYATATVSSKAIAGNYDFYVQQLASRHQVAFEGLQDSDIDTSGKLTITQGTKSFDIDLSKVDSDSDGTNSLTELAAAINAASDNSGVKATLVRSNGEVSLVLASEKTGAENEISFSTSGTGGGAFDTAVNSPRVLSEAKDAIVRLGGESGIELTNASNTFENIIDGVSMTFTKVHNTGDAPLNMAVAQDKSATQAQAQKLVSAFNTLLSTFDQLTASGTNASDRGVLAGDSSVRAIKSMLNQVIRGSYDGNSLIDFGIAADSKGKLSIDTTRFNKAIAENPEGLEKIFSTKGALLDTVDKNLALYTSSSNGILKARKETLNMSLRKIDDEFAKIQATYENQYARYLKQYTNMMQITSAMEQTYSMF